MSSQNPTPSPAQSNGQQRQRARCGCAVDPTDDKSVWEMYFLIPFEFLSTVLAKVGLTVAPFGLKIVLRQCNQCKRLVGGGGGFVPIHKEQPLIEVPKAW